MKVDWVGEYFSALREEGENISIVYGQIENQPNLETPRWFELPHDQFDGISGLAHLLRGQNFDVNCLPVLRGDKFTFLRAVRGLTTVVPEMGVRQQQWRRIYSDREASFQPVEERLAWHLFSEETTANLIAAAKKSGVTVNSYLLFHLDAAVNELFTAPSCSRRWMIPVNLRGAITRHSEAAPHMSFLGVDIEEKGSLGDLHAEVIRMKKRGYHWGAWIMFNAGALIGASGVRKDVRNRKQKNHCWTGIFSNLGAWDVSGGGSWIFCPAVMRATPVGAGCVTMNGRLAVTIQLHDVLSSDKKDSDTLIDSWVNRCLEGAGHVGIDAGEPILDVT